MRLIEAITLVCKGPNEMMRHGGIIEYEEKRRNAERLLLRVSLLPAIVIGMVFIFSQIKI